MATGLEIINKFRTWVDDGTELSAQDELDLLNKVYNAVWIDRPWEFSKKGFSGAISGTSLALPADFSYILEEEVNSKMQRVVRVGNTYYTLVNFSDRRKYTDRSGYCWIDIVAKTINFSETVSGTLTYDYTYTPADLTLTTEPAFPDRFQHCLYHLMASDDYVIQQFDKARSYANENEVKAQDWIKQMAFWNASLLT